MTHGSAETTEAGSGRERLLDAAVHLFAVKGYAATSVRDIVRSAGVTAPALYHHFGNKEGLFLAMVRRGVQRVDLVRREALDTGGSATERIVRLSRAYAAVRRELPEVARAIEQAVAGPPGAAPSIDVEALARERYRQFEELVREGMESGEFRPCVPRHVAMMLVGAIDVALRPFRWDPCGEGPEGALEGMLAVILSGIAPVVD